MRLIDADALAEQLCEDCGLKFALEGVLTCKGSCAIIDTIDAIATVNDDAGCREGYADGLARLNKNSE